MTTHTAISRQRRPGRFLREVSLVMGFVDMVPRISFYIITKNIRVAMFVSITINSGKLAIYPIVVIYAGLMKRFYGECRSAKSPGFAPNSGRKAFGLRTTNLGIQ